MTERAKISRWRRRFYIAAGIFCVVKLTFFLWPHPRLRERVQSSTAIYGGDHRLLRLTMAGDQQYRLWTPLESIAPQLP